MNKINPSKTPFPSIFSPAKIKKPQLDFPDPVNNSVTQPLLLPSIIDKPHSMVPIDFEVPLDYELTEEEMVNPLGAGWQRDREVRLRQHPYFYESRHLSYPSVMFESAPPIVARSMEDMEFEFVDTTEQLASMVNDLKQATEIAVDLEHHDTRTYRGFTCLMQISSRKKDWVVDTLALRGQLRKDKLGGIFVDPTIVKVTFSPTEPDLLAIGFSRRRQ